MTTSPDNIDQIFWDALQLAAEEERQAYLERACGADHELRHAVEKLLRAYPKAAEFLEQPLPAPPCTVDEPLQEGAGTVIGPYKLLEQIGEGGFGVVFMAEQQEPIRRKVALKVLKPGMDTRQVVARFEAERQALALMDHPGIAKVLDGGQTGNGRPYFVMDLVKGLPITEFCDQGQLKPRERLELFVHVCQAVQHAHQKGIIHRDLKPSNVLVTLHDGAPLVKVIDFGIAKALGKQLTDKTLFTGFAQLIGTPLYMSPEQAALSNVDVDTRSDIYSLGVLLYELLTGTTPLDRERLKEVGYDELRRIIREEEPPRPSTRISTLGEAATTVSAQRKSDPKRLSQLCRGELDWIVMKALDKDRNRRYETASGFAMDVQRYLHDEPVLACPPSATYRLHKFLRRNRRAVLAGVVALGVLLMVAVGLAVFTALIWQEMKHTDAARIKAQENYEEAERQKVIARQKAAEAEDKAATANAVYKFLVASMLRAPDPEIALGRKMTVLDALANAEGKIDGAFPNRPLVEADVRYVMATTYSQLGEYTKAQPHYERAVDLWTRHLGRDKRPTLQAMNGLAVVLERRGKLREAQSLQEETLRLQLETFGPKDEETLLSQHNLAVVLDDLGKLKEARQLAEETLAARTSLLGPAHRDTLTTCENLCLILQEQGEWEAARKRHVAILEQLSRILPPEHPDLYRVKHNLAQLLRQQGQLRAAGELLAEVVEARARILGPDHPKTLLSRSSMAFVLAEQGKLADAQKMLAETKDRLVASLGEEHDYTVSAMNDLATVLLQQGQWEQARTLLDKVLALRAAHFGPEHPETCTPMMNLAYLLKNQGKLPEARRYIEKSLALDEKAYGPKHHKTLMAMGELASLLREQHELQPAFDLCQRTIELKKSVLGPKHPSTLYTQANMALILEDQGKRQEAWDLLEKCLEDFREVLGPKHPATLKARHSLAFMLLEDIRRKDRRRLPEARKRFEEVAALREEVLGPDHPDTLNSKWGLVEVLFAVDQVPAEAVDVCNQILASLSRVHGAGHAITLNTRNDVAVWLSNAKKYEEARKMLEENLEQRRRYLGAKHPDTLLTKKRLAETLHMMDRFADASELFAEVVEDMSRSPSFGAGHRATLEVRTNYAVCLSNAGKYAESRKLHEENLELSRRSLGPEDPDTLDTVRRLSQVINMQAIKLWQAGKLSDAEKTFREGLAVIEPVEGKFVTMNDHYRDTLAQLCQNLARMLVASPEAKPEQTAEAVKLAQKAVKLMPHNRLCGNTLALAQYRAGDLKAARTALDEVMARNKGGDCREWFLLAMIQWRAGEKDDARQWFQRAATQMEESKLQSTVASSLRAEAVQLLGIKDDGK
jgi:serine/threonine protein kinase/tetratricopeptide (TPR) repeat protein